MKFSPLSRDFPLLAGSIALALSALPAAGQITPAPEVAPAPEVKADATTPDTPAPAMTAAREAAAEVEAAAEAALLAIREEYRDWFAQRFEDLSSARGDRGHISVITGKMHPEMRAEMLEMQEKKMKREELEINATAALSKLKKAESKFLETKPPEAALQRFLARQSLIKFRDYVESVHNEALEDEHDWFTAFPADGYLAATSGTKVISKNSIAYFGRDEIAARPEIEIVRPAPDKASPMPREAKRVVESVTLAEIRGGKYIPRAVTDWPKKREQYFMLRKRAAVVQANKDNRAEREREKAFAAEENRRNAIRRGR